MPIPFGMSPLRSLSRLRSAVRSIKAALDADPERLERWPITDRDVPTSSELALFDARAKELLGWLRPGGASVAEPILALLTAMPSQSGGGVDHAMRATTFVEDLGDMPLFSVVQACREFRRGTIGEGHWAPTAAEIRRRADCHAVPYRAELAQIQEVLEFDGTVSRAQPPQSPRERVNALFAELMVDLARDRAEAADEARQRAQAALDAIDPTRPMPEMSDALKAKMGLAR